MICNRCGVVNRPGRVACIECLGPLDPAAPNTEPLHCVDHPDTPATGRCVTCQKLVCDMCGGVINRRAVYCVDHAALAMGGAMAPGAAAPAAPAPKKRRWGRSKDGDAGDAAIG